MLHPDAVPAALWRAAIVPEGDIRDARTRRRLVHCRGVRCDIPSFTTELALDDEPE